VFERGFELGIRNGLLEQRITLVGRRGHSLLDQTARNCRLKLCEMTGVQVFPTSSAFQSTCDYAIVSFMILTLSIMFLLGIANFAIHQAVMESGHPLIEQMSGFAQLLGGKATLIAEFAVLLVAMLIAANGWPGVMWGYVGYSALNAGSAWLMLSGRI